MPAWFWASLSRRRVAQIRRPVLSRSGLAGDEEQERLFPTRTDHSGSMDFGSSHTYNFCTGRDYSPPENREADMTMISMRTHTVLGLAATIAMASWASGSFAQTYEMKLGFVTVKGPQQGSSEWYKKEIEKRTNGRIKVKIFPAAQLGKIPRQIEGMQLGTQEAFHTPPGFFVGINQAFQVVDAPGLFDDLDHLHRTINHSSVREKLLRLAENKGFVGCYLFGSGEGAFAAKQPLDTIAKMQGKKIRVLASKLEIELMRVLGMTGVPIPYSEVLPSIQRNVVDGARSAITGLQFGDLWGSDAPPSTDAEIDLSISLDRAPPLRRPPPHDLRDQSGAPSLIPRFCP